MTVTSEPWKRRQYTPDDRAKILVAVKQVGVAEAARRHGVPQTTVSNWLGRDAAKVGAASRVFLRNTVGPPAGIVHRDRTKRAPI